MNSIRSGSFAPVSARLSTRDLQITQGCPRSLRSAVVTMVRGD